MGFKERDNTATINTEQSRPTPAPDAAILNSPERAASINRSPDLRRRALIAGLATTPVLLSLANRSAMGQNVDCSLLSSIILGGSVHDLPPGFAHKNDGFIDNYYQTHCVEGGENGTGNATGNSGQTDQGTNGNTSNGTGNSGNPN
jgi:hypothetical protein